jgi:hypothetical protein
MLERSDPASAPSVRKVFFETHDEAISWLAHHRGPTASGWQPCGRCRPGRPTDGGVAGQPRALRQAGPRGAISGQPDQVFREAEVERLLYAHLRLTGYTVQEKVRIASGIVDAVATRDGERIVIEVKGEDAGGYNSAQMNLQMAVGQISTRMADPGASYAIAFPITSDYVKVLATFRGSIAFERLGLACYLVRRDGEVRRIGAHEVRSWIESLAL